MLRRALRQTTLFGHAARAAAHKAPAFAHVTASYHRAAAPPASRLACAGLAFTALVGGTAYCEQVDLSEDALVYYERLWKEMGGTDGAELTRKQVRCCCGHIMICLPTYMIPHTVPPKLHEITERCRFAKVHPCQLVPFAFVQTCRSRVTSKSSSERASNLANGATTTPATNASNSTGHWQQQHHHHHHHLHHPNRTSSSSIG